MKIMSVSMTKARIQAGTSEFFLYEIGGHLTIQCNHPYELLRYKKGSLSFRTRKGMKMKHAIKDLIQKGKSSSTEIILIDCSD